MTPEFGDPPAVDRVRVDLRRTLDGTLDLAGRLAARAADYAPPRGVVIAPPRVELVPGASSSATVMEVRAHDRPGLLRTVAAALAAAGCGRVGGGRRDAGLGRGRRVLPGAGRRAARCRHGGARPGSRCWARWPDRACGRTGSGRAAVTLADVFATLSDRLAATFKSLRGKGRLTEADIDATVPRDPAGAARGRRRAAGGPRLRRTGQGAGARRRGLPGAQPGAAGRQDRQRGARRDPRRRDPPAPARQEPADRRSCSLGLQGAGKTTLAGKLARWLAGPGPPAAARRRRPPAAQRGRPARRWSASGPAWRSSPPSPATASATRSRWPATPSPHAAHASSTTSSSSTPRAGSASTTS